MLQHVFYHVEIGESSHARPEYRAGLDRPHPQEVGELQRKYGNPLVIVTACHRTANVARNDGYEAGRKQAGAGRPQLLGEQICRYRRQPA